MHAHGKLERSFRDSFTQYVVYQAISIVELFRLSSFHERDTKVDRSLPKNLHSKRKTDVAATRQKLGIMLEK